MRRAWHGYWRLQHGYGAAEQGLRYGAAATAVHRRRAMYRDLGCATVEINQSKRTGRFQRGSPRFGSKKKAG